MLEAFPLFLLGLVIGGVCAAALFWDKLRRAKNQRKKQDAFELKLQEAARTLKARQQEFERVDQALKTRQDEFNARIISYRELKDENAILKRDLQNIDVNLRKVQMDNEVQQQSQKALDQRGKDLGSRYLKENVKWIGSGISANNYSESKQRLLDVIERCRGIGLEIPGDTEAQLLADLKGEFEKAVRAEIERGEQARIKAQIREEQLREKEVERELKQLERERAAIKAALDKALAEAHDQHSEEVERLKARLAEAEEKSRRAMSQAQMTRSGHVYVISNIGSFGESVYKIGMTRRLEPVDRIYELSNASVPFPYDIHMMISSDDAPSLETALHRELHKHRVNKVKPRKEFFKTDIQAICEIVKKHHGEVQYVADPEALQYRQSLSMSDEDQEFIEQAYDAAEEGSQGTSEDE